MRLSLALLAALSPLGALARSPAAPQLTPREAPAAPPVSVATPAPGTLRTVTLCEALTIAVKQSPDVVAAQARATVEIRRAELAAAAGRIAASLEQRQSEQPRP